MSPLEPFLLACAPNGARHRKAEHPGIPLTTGEIADSAAEIAEAGAAMLHLHVRDEAGNHSLDAGRYREAIAEIRGRLGDRLLIQITTEAVGHYQPDEQMRCVRQVVPEAVSLALREIVPASGDTSAARNFYRWIEEAGVFPQHILYSPTELDRFEKLRAQGMFGDRTPFVLLVLGHYEREKKSRPADLLAFFQKLPAEITWMVCAFGREEAAVAALAASLGGHARIGFENNIHLPDGSIAASNGELLRPTATVARSIGRPLMSVEQLRALARS